MVKNTPVPAFLRESVAGEPPEAIDLTGDSDVECVDLETFICGPLPEPDCKSE